MDRQLLAQALKKRRGRKFNTQGFLDELKEPQAESGMDSSNLNEKKTIEMGGERKDSRTATQGQVSNDELAPTQEEMERKGVETSKEKPLEPFKDMKDKSDGGRLSPNKVDDDDLEASEVGGSFDSGVFDEREYERVKRKKKPTSLYERMQYSLGRKLKGE